ncbi:MAG: hypothetical protein AB8B55_03375 [Mariniblastus sp.]
MKLFLSILLLTLLAPSVCLAQAKHPHVDEIIKKFDANLDGWLTKEEVAKNRRYAGQFPRWDTDKNGKVSAAEIAKLRSAFGIAADGTMISKKQNGNRNGNRNRTGKVKPFVIPDVADLIRTDRDHRPTRKQASNSEYVLGTTEHLVSGTAYVVLTDHTDEAYLEPLRRLVAHRNGKLLVLNNLSELSRDQKLFENISKQLKRNSAKYVAVAPRLDTFSENTLLSVWAMLSTLDTDPQLDCYPGFLVASNAKSFSRLIDQTVAHKPIAPKQLKPFAISQVQNSTETRSLQKSGILRKHFKKADVETPIVAIYGKTAGNAPRLPGDNVWNLKIENRRQFVKQFPADAQQAFDAANLIVMHGHGIPGMSCSMDVDGLPGDCSGKILMSGSCFSACPTKSDLPKMGQAPGGYQVEQRDAFVVRAIDNGAIAAFGHQRLSSGFPHLYPVLESWTEGHSIGQAYQELMNALILKTKTSPSGFVISDQEKNNKRVRQNTLLYVVIGDPALVPFESQPLLR